MENERNATKDRRSITRDDIASWSGPQAPIIFNAIRLLDDACVLRKDRRYASATALAILSIEEIGKFVLTHERFRSRVPPRESRERNARFTHREKQWAAALMVRDVMGMDEITALINLAGFELVLVQRDSDPENNPTMEKIISGIKDESLDDFLAKSYFGEHLKFLVHLLRGQFDNVKQKCFYVDDDRNGLIISGPDQIDRRTCDGAMRTAKKAIWATKVELRRYWRFVLSKQ
ncbi:AbiV family abortive infection protein [Mesorhizobium sp. VK23B]|uniref:AbiV family abortive infection protein n=1 Tax=Mesorhizobium dulcispinae TaxID=3072316 RepID=A0ABU4XLL5_9HYPH|nr:MULTISPECIES: AbiV family abortive infection protein [unclassified Mesorhizobium]MDX8469218.1 AbiV family abortive infection protein [Mesorhizobium sp. VK23B]MDX8475649.1 AbiV family abortive infection protein [Mesorhizobium sp. VK23A]